jgi:hypothetical protein
MREEFPELGYCHNNWKADQIAIDNYLPWYGPRWLKEEPDVMLIGSNPGSNKRPQSNLPNPNAK